MSEKKCVRKTGRYPWGKGLVFENGVEFYNKVRELQQAGMLNDQIMIKFNKELPEECRMKTGDEFKAAMNRAQRAKYEQSADQIQEMRNEGLTWTEISRKLGITESTARRRLQCYGRKEEYSNFLSKVNLYKAQGMNEKEIVEQLNKTLPGEYQLSLADFRVARAIALSKTVNKNS